MAGALERQMRLLLSEIEGRERELGAAQRALVASLKAELTRRAGPRPGRLRALRGRLEDLLAQQDFHTDQTVTQAEGWARDGLEGFYALGATFAGSLFAWDTGHRISLAARRRLLLDPVVRAGRLVDLQASQASRRLGRALGQVIGGGAPSVLADALAREFSRRPMGTVIYANGARHAFGEYVATMIATHSALTRGEAALNQGRRQGIEAYQISDGRECGLASHADPLKADGLIVPAAIANEYTIAHPRCQRQITPRGDLSRDDLSFV